MTDFDNKSVISRLAFKPWVSARTQFCMISLYDYVIIIVSLCLSVLLNPAKVWLISLIPTHFQSNQVELDSSHSPTIKIRPELNSFTINKQSQDPIFNRTCCWKYVCVFVCVRVCACVCVAVYVHTRMSCFTVFMCVFKEYICAYACTCVCVRARPIAHI